MRHVLRRIKFALFAHGARGRMMRTYIPQERCMGSQSFAMFKDTIYAVSSGRGKCGVAVIRVSGSLSKEIMMMMGCLATPPKPRQALLRTVICPKSKEKLDSGLLLWFPAPHSFTGEDCVEMQVHGGVAVVTAILNSINSFPSTRHAEAGEFTKRAFMNGKLDLTEVEGLADVIHAETEAQRRQAFRQMSGELNVRYTKWREIVVKCTASIEAYIDFSEEENIEDGLIEDVRSALSDLSSQLRQHLSDGRRGERLRDGVQIAILGRPNVGKSSLINYVSRRPVAIVSPIEGTTRDSIESVLDLNGYPIVLADTAGLRATTDIVEKEGVRRALNRSQEADLLIVMLSITELSSANGITQDIAGKVTQLLSDHLEGHQSTEDKAMVIVVNKTDLNPDISNKCSETIYSTVHGKVTPVLFTSLTEGQGLATLLAQLTDSVKSLCGDPLTDSPTYTQARHRNHLFECLSNVDTALDLLNEDVVLTAESLRLACVEIGQITGKISSEDILDVVFRDFCIGK